MEQQTNGPALREYFSMLRRRRWAVLVVLGVTTAAVAAGTYLTPPIFRASTTVIVKFGREFIYRPVVGSADTSRTFSPQEMVNDEVAILGSRDLAKEVVEAIGIERLYPDLGEELYPDMALAKATAAFQDHVSIAAVFDSSVIGISFEHGVSKVAAEALNVLVERFKDKHLEIFGESKSDFLKTQLEKFEEQLADAETTLQSFKQENGVYELTAQKTAILTQRVQLQTALREVRFRVAELEQQRKAFSGDPGEAFQAVQLPSLSQQRSGLISARAEVTSLLQEADSKIAELTRSLERWTDRAGGDNEGSDANVGAAPPQPGVERFRSIDEAHLRLLDLKLKYLELRRNYKKESREARAVQNKVLLVRKFLEGRGEYVGQVLEMSIRDELSSLEARRDTLAAQVSQLDTDVESLDRLGQSLQLQAIATELATLEFKENTLVEEIAQLDKELAALDRGEKVLRQLERTVAVTERSFESYAEKFEEAHATRALDEQKIVNIAVIEKATPPVAPAGLPRRVKILLGAVVGLLAGLAAAFFLELLAVR
jgi:uncharacterized protein involved in exopolysaccharide biosynthesis